jgi:DNA-binding transcriptional regulator YiaG
MNGIKAIRAQLNLSQEAFGAGIGKTQANVSLYEVAGQAVKPDVALRVIKLARKHGFDCTFNDVYSENPKLRRLERKAA